MKVMMMGWIAALTIAYLVAGRSLEQALLAGKVVVIGFVLGFLGAKLSDVLHAYQELKARHAISSHRRK